MSMELWALVALLVINTLTAWMQSGSEKDFEAKHPRFKACMDLLAGVGIDPAKVLGALATMLRGAKK